MKEPISPALRAVSAAVLAVAAELSVDEVLQRLVDSARELAGARYAALGIPDDAGGFRTFLVSGMSDELVASMGPLPRTHGMLGAMLQMREPYLTDDLYADPRFKGWWPSQHPDMRSFLGVPIAARDRVIGAFYLTEKLDGRQFGDGDRELIELLAAHAAIAITNARLYERSRELSSLSERNRLALELHDVVSQKLFSLNLAADAAATLLERDPVQAPAQLQRVRQLTRESLAELRALILGLRPADLARDGLTGALAKEVEMLRQVHAIEIELDVDPAQSPEIDADRDAAVLRIAQEALHNAVRHAAARRVTIGLSVCDDELTLTIADDGVGFDPSDPALRSRRLGLTSMEERAGELGGRLTVRSAIGAGTTVTLTLPANPASPADPPNPADPANRPAAPTPRFRAFYNTAFSIACGYEGQCSEDPARAGGQYSNIDNQYMSAFVSRGFRAGAVLVLHGELPTTPRTGPGVRRMGGGQLRYWSLCQNESLYTTIGSGCVYDSQVPLGPRRRYTIVTSLRSQRPSNAIARCGVAWIPWPAAGDGDGHRRDGLLLVPNMLPSSSFHHAIQDTTIPGDERAVLGPSYPIGHYTTAAAFERRGCRR